MLAAAIALIAEKGFDKATTGEIGQRAGYSREMVRHRYGSKEDLLEALMEQEYRPLLLRDPDPRLSGLDQALEHLDTRRVAREQPELLRGFFVLCFESVGPIPHLVPWMTRWFTDYRAAIAAALRAGQADGTVDPALDAGRAARDAITFGAGLGFRWTLEPATVDFGTEFTEWLDRLSAEWAAVE